MNRATLVARELVFMAPPFALAQNQPFAGTWKVDVAKASRPLPGGQINQVVIHEKQ